MAQLRVPVTEVARRAGHGVAVLLKIYAHCIDRRADAASKRVANALGARDAGQGPSDEAGPVTRGGCRPILRRGLAPGPQPVPDRQPRP
jgi:hypothetical protein